MLLRGYQPADARDGRDLGRAPRSQYYELLDGVRRDGDWEAWLSFFLDGVAQTADSAVRTAQRLESLFAADREKIQQEGRAAGSALRVHRVLEERPISSIQAAAAHAGLSFPAERQ